MSEGSSPFQVHPYLQSILTSCEDEAWIKVEFNGVDLWLPAGTILTMAHCMIVSSSGKIVLNVETSHLEWMRSRLSPGAVFVDIGAATGAMTLPIARSHPAIEIIAFEPAQRARRLLKSTLFRNDISGVKIVPKAISDRNGTTKFLEYGVNEDGSIPFLPEASTLAYEQVTDWNHEIIEVETMTLDTVAENFGWSGRHLVVKMDIEGFEGIALEGGANFFTNNHVSIAIDIHASPGSSETTLDRCERTMSSYGYRQRSMIGHVLICTRD